METTPNVIVYRGFREADRDVAAELFWEAFGPKLEKPLGPRAKGLVFVSKGLKPACFFSAYERMADGTEQILGIVGCQTKESGPTMDLGMADIWGIYGPGSLWRTPAISMLDTEVDSSTLYVDCICVGANARGKGVGSLLLKAADDEAIALRKKRVALSVIDSNPRAKALYERVGFRTVDTSSMGPLQYLFGFKKADFMVKPLRAPPAKALPRR